MRNFFATNPERWCHLIRAQTSTAWTIKGTLRSCWQQVVELGKPWACSCQKVTSRTRPSQPSRSLCSRSRCALMRVFVLFRGKRERERHARLQLPSSGHSAAQRPEEHPRGSVAGAWAMFPYYAQFESLNNQPKTSQVTKWYDYYYF